MRELVESTFVADRDGAFSWSMPDEEQFRFHIAQTRELEGFLLGRRLYETMLVWERDPSLRESEPGVAFADELRMFRNPVVLGGGTPFLPPVTEDVRLDLIETRTFGSRVTYERYGRAEDD
jgi:dihydrofolate reductase